MYLCSSAMHTGEKTSLSTQLVLRLTPGNKDLLFQMENKDKMQMSLLKIPTDQRERTRGQGYCACK